MDSKFCQIAFSNFLDSLLQFNGVCVRSYAVHPGFSKTDTWKSSEWVKHLGVLQRLLFKVGGGNESLLKIINDMNKLI